MGDSRQSHKFPMKSTIIPLWYGRGTIFRQENVEPMANRRVSLYRKCKTPDGWRRYQVAMSANGKVKPNAVIVDGKEAVFAVGHYELRSFEGSKTKWTRVKGNATEALAELKQAQKRANAV